MSGDGRLWNRGEAPSDRPSFTCPQCGATSHNPHDVRFGYCGQCHEFTGEPTDFVLHGDPEFSERVSDRIEHLWSVAPITLLTDEDRQRMWEENLAALRIEQRMALAIKPPEGPVEFERFKTRVLARSWRARWACRWSRMKWWLRDRVSIGR